MTHPPIPNVTGHPIKTIIATHRLAYAEANIERFHTLGLRMVDLNEEEQKALEFYKKNLEPLMVNIQRKPLDGVKGIEEFANVVPVAFRTVQLPLGYSHATSEAVIFYVDIKMDEPAKNKTIVYLPVSTKGVRVCKFKDVNWNVELKG